MAGDQLEQYFALLKGQKARLKQALSYKGQKPPTSSKRSREDLELEFAMAAMSSLNLASRQGLSSMTTFRSCFIGEAYSPSTQPLRSLQPIFLRDLTLETQHRGRVLIVRAFAEPNNQTSIQNAVEDELGDVERLAIYNLLPNTPATAILPRGAIVAIKEPYYKRTADGGLFVRVDHPTDFVPLKPGDSSIPPRLAGLVRAVTESRSLSALDLKEKGNTAFKTGDLQVAVDCYSEALDVCGRGDDDNRLRHDLLRNRAAANLRLGRYESVITDALASLTTEEETASGAAREVNIKALYRAGKAAYEMQDFYSAKQYFEQALQLDENHKEARAELSRTGQRISEQETGAFNFSAMAKSATMDHPRLDHASFLQRTKVAPAEGRGRGLFATVALEPGDVVFVEKAFHTAHRNGMSDVSVLLNLNTDTVSLGTHSLRLYGLVDKMIWNPTLAKQYLDLFDGGKFGGEKEPQIVDGKVIVDTFRVQSIAELNGFGCLRVRSRDGKQNGGEATPDHEKSTGIWLRASYANHSCLPNATRCFLGDMMIVRAVHPIPAGGEIFMQYTDPDKPLTERRKRLKNSYRFDCDCTLCRADAQVPKATMEKRVRLGEEIGAFLTANPVRDHAQVIPAAKKAKAKRLLEAIRATYPEDSYERLPRLGCADTGLWVAGTSYKQPRDALRLFRDVLRDLGYFVTVQGDSVTIDRRAAAQRETALHAAMYMAQCLAATGNDAAASVMEGLGRDIYIAMTGTEDGFAAEF